MLRIGYTTGTFDGCHLGQLRFLQSCRQLLPNDARLIVGLTTDELAVKQKRRPSMTYEHRRAILLGLQGLVDDVLPHNGDDKVMAWQKIGFSDVFIGDEYFGSAEYQAIAMKGVPVHYMPRHPHDHWSSSELAIKSAIEQARKLKIVSMAGPGGPIYMFQDSPESVVIKSIKVSEREYRGARTANVYHLPIPNPRNFKRLGEVHKYPNIPGVNSFREIDIQPFLKDQSWCSTLSVDLIYREGHDMPIHPDTETWTHLNRDKDQPREVYFIYQQYAGPTLSVWIDRYEHESGFVLQLQQLVGQVRTLCRDLLRLGVVHGDLHSNNLCVSLIKAAGPTPVLAQGACLPEPRYQLKVIDFGWCLHRSFDMAAAERTYYEQCLQTDWDWLHFRDSMAYSYHDRSWWAQLQLPTG